MFVELWRMRARKKKAKDYESFGRQMTLAALKKIDGCQEAYFIKVLEARKPEYLWVAFWRDRKALEAARTNPAWREHTRKFEAGKFYKTAPLELVAECLDSFRGASAQKPKRSARPAKTKVKEKQQTKAASGAPVRATVSTSQGKSVTSSKAASPPVNKS